MKSTFIKVLIAGMLIGVIITLRWLGVGSSLTLESIIEQRNALQLYVQNHYFAAVLLYILFLACVVLFTIPVSIFITVAGGLLFGTFLGGLYSTIGSTLGASLSFLLIRYLLSDIIVHYFNHKLRTFNQAFAHHGASYLLFMQLLPITPFAVITIVAGLSPSISLLTFVWTTFLGIFPGSLMYAYAGNHLSFIDSSDGILSWRLLFCLLLLALMALIPIVLEKLKIITHK